MPKRSLRCFAILLVLAGGSGRTNAQDRATYPDLVLLRAKVFTADSTRPWAEALAVAGGRITAVGGTGEIERLAGPATVRIDLGGRVVVPGFNDAHAHFSTRNASAARFSLGRPPFADAPFAEVLDSLRGVGARTPPGTWIIAGVGPTVLDDSSARRDALDRVAPRHPVYLHAAGTGHGAILNSAALRALGVADSPRDPLGGWYERSTGGGGRISGLLHGYAAWDARRRLTLLAAPAEHARALRAYGRDALRYGITSQQVMVGDLGIAVVLQALRSEPFPVRLRLIRFPLTDASGRVADEWRSADWDVPAGEAGRDLPLVTVSGIKWVLDGTPIERLAVMRAPYADRAGWYGRANFPPDTVRAVLREALGSDDQLLLHVSGDSMPALVLSLMRELAGDSAWRQRRVRFEHGDGLAPDLIAAAQALGVVVVQNPSHLGTPEVIRSRLGAGAGSYQLLRSFVERGVPLAFGSDGPSNPFLNIMFAVTHPTNPSEALTREQAVSAYTRGAAYAEKAERRKGTLAPGMLADLAVLSQDIFTVPVQELPRTESLLTIVDGKIAFDAGVLKASGGQTTTPRGSAAAPRYP